MQETKTDNDFDLIIIGGGLAGASLACALRNIAHENTPLKIAVVEAFALDSDAQPSYDDRTVALSYGSRCIFDGMGLWRSLSPYAQPIDTIHISDRGHFGVTRLTKEQEGVDALGYVLENRSIGQQLYATMLDDAVKNISLFCPAQLAGLQQDEHGVSVELVVDGEIKQLKGKLLVAADGNNSQVMKLLAIGNSRQDYQQSALITNITPGKKHNNVAYERFTDSGPLAFLPMTENRCSVVWTLGTQQAEELCALDEKDFIARLQERFGYRLGQIKKVGSRHVYPLFLQSATQMVQGRVALIGNAAHSVHPVAGQGFNLALRDIALLSELLVDSLSAGDDLSRPEVLQVLLQEYVSQREQDIKRVYRFTDTLVKTFSNSISPIGHLRSISLQLVDIVPDIKHQLALQSMGLTLGSSTRLTRLNRGLSL
ncbi:MAG: 2-octaprenyl-6-methoxyphenyl hydroxylase [Proteobacteria bacterium]|nr:2-octaprenyl-6-methoxyphenyl hydroxylase [Pseudomonadota bacterium]